MLHPDLVVPAFFFRLKGRDETMKVKKAKTELLTTLITEECVNIQMSKSNITIQK